MRAWPMQGSRSAMYTSRTSSSPMAAVIPPNQGKPNANSDLGGIPHITVPPAHFLRPPRAVGARYSQRPTGSATHRRRSPSAQLEWTQKQRDNWICRTTVIFLQQGLPWRAPRVPHR